MPVTEPPKAQQQLGGRPAPRCRRRWRRETRGSGSGWPAASTSTGKTQCEEKIKYMFTLKSQLKVSTLLYIVIMCKTYWFQLIFELHFHQCNVYIINWHCILTLTARRPGFRTMCSLKKEKCCSRKLSRSVCCRASDPDTSFASFPSLVRTESCQTCRDSLVVFSSTAFCSHSLDFRWVSRNFLWPLW